MPTPKKGTRLGGSPAHQRLILANLATALFEHGRITTTEAKARTLRPVRGEADHQGQEGRPAQPSRGPQDHPRQVGRARAVHRDRARRFAERPGGYTRITKIGPRKGDNAPMAVIELVTEAYTPKPAASKSSKPAAPKSAGPRRRLPPRRPTDEAVEAPAEDAPAEDVPGRDVAGTEAAPASTSPRPRRPRTPRRPPRTRPDPHAAPRPGPVTRSGGGPSSVSRPSRGLRPARRPRGRPAVTRRWWPGAPGLGLPRSTRDLTGRRAWSRCSIAVALDPLRPRQPRGAGDAGRDRPAARPGRRGDRRPTRRPRPTRTAPGPGGGGPRVGVVATADSTRADRSARTSSVEVPDARNRSADAASARRSAASRRPAPTAIRKPASQDRRKAALCSRGGTRVRARSGGGLEEQAGEEQLGALEVGVVAEQVQRESLRPSRQRVRCTAAAPQPRATVHSRSALSAAYGASMVSTRSPTGSEAGSACAEQGLVDAVVGDELGRLGGVGHGLGSVAAGSSAMASSLRTLARIGSWSVMGSSVGACRPR